MVRLRVALTLMLLVPQWSGGLQPADSPRRAEARRSTPTAVLIDKRVMLTLPETILRDSRVRSRLDSALTTTFILKTKSVAVARIEIRYDLWDEVYRVKRIEAANRVAEQQIAGLQRLEQWWRTPIDAGPLDDERRAIEIELIVLPFSAAEEKDARQWLSKSGGAGGPADARTVVDVLIGTTLSARPIVSYRWSVEIARR